MKKMKPGVMKLAKKMGMPIATTASKGRVATSMSGKKAVAKGLARMPAQGKKPMGKKSMGKAFRMAARSY